MKLSFKSIRNRFLKLLFNINKKFKKAVLFVVIKFKSLFKY